MAYEMRISDWISDVCSSDLGERAGAAAGFSRAESENSNPAARDQLPDNDDDGDDEQQMDEPARDVEGEEAAQPQNEQNDGNGPQPGLILPWRNQNAGGRTGAPCA